jgi:PhzF family phenazine biosynthesis protein
MELQLYQVDAFTSAVFGGNPAAVCPLSEWLPDDVLQKIARENNLSETAFLVPEQDGHRIRWFTPTVEVDLCGHATLASAHVLFHRAAENTDKLRFLSQSGELLVRRDGGRIQLDFPARRSARCEVPTGLLEALEGPAPVEVLGPKWLIVYEDEAAVRAVRPDFEALSSFDNVIVTAPGSDVDFVSRFFAPSCGVNEDPVTGSAHCTSVPYWAKRLGKPKVSARQVSQRGGELFCEDQGDRVLIAGDSVLYLEGRITI